jgi:endonuclease YncB( thermonuclease family)
VAWLVASVSPSPVISPPVLVLKVPDGNSVQVAALGHVRLLGIAAPPLTRGNGASPPFALQAQQRLAGLVQNRWVRFEYDGAAGSRHSAYLFLETGVFVNELLVREGLARATGRTGLARSEALKSAQAEARAARRGIWGLAR